MTTGPQGNGMLHHDEAHAEALATVPITLLAQVGDGDPRPIGRETISVPVMPDPDGTGMTLDAEQMAKATVQAIIRILTKDLIPDDEEATA